MDGYYITNGKAIKIKCIKTARDEKTVYKDLDGNEIEVNDGNTFIQICPKDSKVVIEGEEDTNNTTNTVNKTT
jgi:regulator of sirC expression with transglutaminase-like and TPR domain